jgi:hypothetical protein
MSGPQEDRRDGARNNGLQRLPKQEVRDQGQDAEHHSEKEEGGHQLFWK